MQVGRIRKGDLTTKYTEQTECGTDGEGAEKEATAKYAKYTNAETGYILAQISSFRPFFAISGNHH